MGQEKQFAALEAIVKGIKRKYAEMFISMSTDFLMGGIAWETFVSNIGIAAKAMRSVEAPSKDAQEDGP